MKKLFLFISFSLVVITGYAQSYLQTENTIRIMSYNTQNGRGMDKPYLQSPATDAMTVMWLTNVPCHSWVEYGTDSLNMQQAQTWIEGEALAYNTLNRRRFHRTKRYGVDTQETG